MKILVDGDGCPVVKQTIEIAHRKNVGCVVVCDTSHRIESSHARVVTVDKGADSADFVLVNMVFEKDIVITQDYGLAAMCLARKARVLDQNGREYTPENIDSLLEQRHSAGEMRRRGRFRQGLKKRTHHQDSLFYELLNKILQEEMG